MGVNKVEIYLNYKIKESNGPKQDIWVEIINKINLIPQIPNYLIILLIKILMIVTNFFKFQ